MRRGVILVEVMVGCAMAGVLMALCVQLLSMTAVERRVVEQRAIALEQAANLIEQAGTIPYEQLNSESLDKLTLPAQIEPLLPAAKARWSVAEETGVVPAKRLRVEVTWRARPQRPVGITSWAYPNPAGARP